MYPQACVQSCHELFQKILFHREGRSQHKSPLLLDQTSLDPVWRVNPRLSALQETAAFYANGGLAQPIVVDLPCAKGGATVPVETPPPVASRLPVYINPTEQNKVEISDPVERAPVEAPTPVGPAKYAHR